MTVKGDQLAPKRPLEGRVALITGAGRGLGAAYANLLSDRGAAVVVNDVIEANAQDVVDSIRSAGGRAVLSGHNVGDRAAAQKMVETTVREFGSLDILINNAGRMRGGYFEDLTDLDIDDVINTHLEAAFYVTQPAWRVMQEQRFGRVVMTSSSAGLFGYQGSATYSSVKAGLYGLTKVLAFEGAEYDITVNIVLPWAVSLMGVDHPNPDAKRNYDFFVGSDLSEDHWRKQPMLTALLVAHLVDPDCVVTGEAFSVCRGRYARAYVGLTDGWIAPDETVGVEDIAANMDAIRDVSKSSVPMWVYDELAATLRQLGISAGRTDGVTTLPRSSASRVLDRQTS
jgi:NAD(P)-dependent dehydrogenase (short-subunit alcohol dehydrogenase family)